MAGVGRPERRIDGRAQVTGSTKFTADFDLPGLAHARLVLSPYAAARISGVDFNGAADLPGVLAAVAGSDLPEVSARGPQAPLARGRVYFAGQPVVAVVAETEAIAADAVNLIHVDFDRDTPVISFEQAVADGAPRVLENASSGLDDAAAHGGAVTGGDLQAERPANVTAGITFSQGDVHRALAAAELVVEGSYEAPQVHQGFLESHIATARHEADGTYTIWCPTQGIFPTRSGVADALGLPVSSIRVIQTEVGGGFGGKMLLLEPLAALLSKITSRPVRLALSRTEEFLMGRGAPAFRIDIKVGARRDGTMSALWAHVRCDNGAGQGGLGGLAATMLVSTYRIPDYAVSTMEVATNKTPVAAYRAPGALQAYFALESAVDELAARIGMDPIKLRLLNAVQEGDPRPNGLTWPRIAFKECLDAAAAHPMYTMPLGPGEGVGVAAGAWMGGLEPAAAGCRVESDGTVVLLAGHADISGTNTTLALIAAEVFGVPIESVRIRGGDTETAPYAGMAGGSKTIYTVGAAVHQAVIEARRQLIEIAAEEMEAAAGDLELRDGHVSVKGVPGRRIPIGQLAGLATRFGGRYKPVFGSGQSAQVEQSPMFTVQIARVKVDSETGEWRLVGVAAIQDVGKALNPPEIVGQVHGGSLQGMGRAIGERMIWDDDGALRNPTFIDYGIPSIDQAAPDFDVQLLEIPSLHGPFGAKGVGEPPAVPGSAAVANAIRAAVGRRLEKMPFDFPVVSGFEAERP